jgi:predicted transposase/invertase (TIGR01784 family)
MGTIAQDFIDQGVNIGKAEGRAEGKAQVAKKLLLKNVPVDEVADITDLCINQVLDIARKI